MNASATRPVLSASAVLTLSVMTSVCHAQPQFEHRWHVDASASGANDGSGWQDAFTDLQDALSVAEQTAGQTDEIWVAAGTYYPCDPDVDPNCNPSVSFNLVEDTTLYGGFLGTNHPSGGETLRSQRDPLANETILSGDINQDDDPLQGPGDNNSRHVVRAEGIDSTAVLDGFVVTRGFADGGGTESQGGGILINNGSPVIRHCKLTRNAAAGGGAGIEVAGNSAPVAFNCSFLRNNTLAPGGGGMRLDGSSPGPTRVVNCVFAKQGCCNSGAIYAAGPDLEVTNCTFYFNDHGSEGMFNISNGSQAAITNSIIWKRAEGPFFAVEAPGSSLTVSFTALEFDLGSPPPPGVIDGGGNIVVSDPKFRSTANDDYRLQDDSPCIDLGSDAAVPDDIADVDDDGDPAETLPWDRDDGMPLTHWGRFFDVDDGPASFAGVDMGAYENQHIRSCRWDIANASAGPPPDGQVGNADLLRVNSDWGPCPGCGADFDGDLLVSTSDLNELLQHWGFCPPVQGGSGGSAGKRRGWIDGTRDSALLDGLRQPGGLLCVACRGNGRAGAYVLADACGAARWRAVGARACGDLGL